jgi:hypothetical protein
MADKKEYINAELRLRLHKWGPYPERTEEQERERQEAEDRAGESRMEQRREMSMRKVLVISEDSMSAMIADAARHADESWAAHDEAGGSYWDTKHVQLAAVRAAMTEVNIPDGCKLAVVAMNDMPSNDPTGGKDTRVWYAEHYRRVVQEVM